MSPAGSVQTWIFDLRAARNGNGLDAALILLDEQAREIAHNEDYFIWDPFIEHKFERSGTYTVVVQPTHTQLDPNFAYQLDIRTAPHIETVSPISMPPGASLDATLYGSGLLDKSAKLTSRAMVTDKTRHAAHLDERGVSIFLKWYNSSIMLFRPAAARAAIQP